MNINRRWVRHKSGKLIEVETVDPVPTEPKPKKKRPRVFVMVTQSQRERLLKVERVTTYHVFLYLLELSFRARSKTVQLSNVTMAKINIERRRKYRALNELESLGLIRLEKFGRQSPKVTILELTENADDTTKLKSS
jgi:hypothetical protein